MFPRNRKYVGLDTYSVSQRSSYQANVLSMSTCSSVSFANPDVVMSMLILTPGKVFPTCFGEFVYTCVHQANLSSCSEKGKLAHLNIEADCIK